MVGSEKKFVSALIVPAFPYLTEWAEKQGIDTRSHHELLRNEKVTALYKEIVEGFNQSFNHVEQVKKFELLPDEWTIDTGELTPKLSLKRKVVLEKYRDVINKIYQ